MAPVPPILETPCVVVDRTRLAENIRRVQDIADANGLRLRPHAKTHKSLLVAGLQIAAGAVGLTCAKPGEAQVFVEGGVSSVTLAYPIIEARRLDALLGTARGYGAEIRTIADSLPGVAALAEAAQRHGVRLPVFMKVDVGLHRIGVDPKGPAALAVARAIAGEGALAFQGLIAHAGHAYAAADPDAIADVAEAERRTLLELKERLEDEGIEVPEVSVGSTPTVLAQRDFSGLTEIRPGNYVFLDGTALRLGIAKLEDIALTVRTTVVAVTERHAIIDAGSKVLSSDLGAHGTGGGAGYGLAFREGCVEGPGAVVERLSEEHGFVRLAGAGWTPAIGDRLVIVPNHACVVANLAETLVLTGSERPPEAVPVDARARVR